MPNQNGMTMLGGPPTGDAPVAVFEMRDRGPQQQGQGGLEETFAESGALGVRLKHMIGLCIAACNGSDYFVDVHLRRLREAHPARSEVLSGVRRCAGVSATSPAFVSGEEWIVEATFRKLPGTVIPFEHSKDEGRTRELEVPGEITFSKDGTDYALAAIKSGRALQIVFSDATSGVDTYSVGRFLFVAPDAAGKVTLDFNRAVLPPCGFSYAFNCPMPPKQNRFAVPIEAGEKNVLAKDGSLLH